MPSIIPVIGAENAAVKTPHSPASAKAPIAGIVGPNRENACPQPEPAAAPMKSVGISAPPEPPEPKVSAVAAILPNARMGARQPRLSPVNSDEIVVRPVPATRGMAKVSAPTHKPPTPGTIQLGIAVQRSNVFSRPWMEAV